MHNNTCHKVIFIAFMDMLYLFIKYADSFYSCLVYMLIMAVANFVKTQTSPLNLNKQYLLNDRYSIVVSDSLIIIMETMKTCKSQISPSITVTGTT